MDKKTIFHLNPSGRFVIGDPMVTLVSLEERLSWIPMVWCLFLRRPYQGRQWCLYCEAGCKERCG